MCERCHKEALEAMELERKVLEDKAKYLTSRGVEVGVRKRLAEVYEKEVVLRELDAHGISAYED